jgi:hypothetical protein
MSANTKERVLVALLCILAGVRVFVFSAAFPFFSNIDEDLHFDLIMRYSAGQVPGNFDLLSGQTVAWIVPYASPEFLQRPDGFPGGKFPSPLWKQPPDQVAAEIEATKAAWASEINFESSQPPLYYTIGALWWRLGQLIGLSGINALYWLRFLNVVLVGLIVWLGYLVARIVDPEHLDVRLGVALLLAVIPHNVFYSLNNDVLSAVCGGALFLALVRWLQTESAGLTLGLITGFAAAAAYLTKIANLPLIIAASIALIAISLWRVPKQPARALGAFAAYMLSAAVPIAAWMLWSKMRFGDLTGSAPKVMLLGWTYKPMADWWTHPIFTAHGLSIFWSELIASFWRGEMIWHKSSLSWTAADQFYAVSTVVLLCLAAIGLCFRTGALRLAIALALISFLASIAFLALLSVQFDFGRCINPSREHPYFTSGRLLSGALVPFALAYVYGIAWLLRRIAAPLPLLVVSVIAASAAVSGIAIDRPVFESDHNWFHR